MKQVCLTKSYFYQKVKMKSLYQVNSQCMKVQHTDSHSISVDTFKHTQTNELKFV